MRNAIASGKFYTENETDSGILYEIEVIERLRLYENENRGKILQLCDIHFDDRELPLVGFTTGDDILVTARHHIGEAFGTDEAIYRLIEDGVEGITAVPVVDIKNYDSYQRRIRKWFKDAENGEYRKFIDCPDWTALCVFEMMRGYKAPPSNAKNDWDFYKYGSIDLPIQSAEIEKLISGTGLVFDLHNGIEDYHFITKIVDTESHDRLKPLIIKLLESRNHVVREDCDSAYILESPGFCHTFDDSFGLLSNATKRAGINLYTVETPTIKRGQGGNWCMRDTEYITETNKDIIALAIEALNN